MPLVFSWLFEKKVQERSQSDTSHLFVSPPCLDWILLLLINVRASPKSKAGSVLNKIRNVVKLYIYLSNTNIWCAESSIIINSLRQKPSYSARYHNKTRRTHRVDETAVCGLVGLFLFWPFFAWILDARRAKRGKPAVRGVAWAAKANLYNKRFLYYCFS